MLYRNIARTLAGLALLSGVGCAGDVGTIDRTQPNAIDKSMFQGLWYYRGTIVESDPAAGDVDGSSSGLDKIRWEINETRLVGYRTYEFVPYAEGLTDEGRDFFGAPVVAYAITSHFDIQRDYNKTTGVESNVIVENSTDRPWYERKYMRIDWTQNLVGGPTAYWTGWQNYPDATLSAYGIASYYHQSNDANDPHRPVFTKDYIDVTNSYHVEPDQYYCYYLLLYNNVPRCGAQNVQVRLSFRKVDVTDDYQSLYYPDNVELKDDSGNAIVIDFNGRQCNKDKDPGDCRVATFPYFEAFGNFRTLRVAYDTEYYLTRSGRIYNAGRFDIWKDSYNDTTGALLPYNERTPKPIIYMGNVDFPDDMIPYAEKLADMWNTPFMETVAHLQGKVTPDGKADFNRLHQEYGEDFVHEGTTQKLLRMVQFRQNTCNVKNVQAYARANGLVEVVEGVAGSIDRVARGNIEQVCAAMQYAELKAGKTLDGANGTQKAFTWEREGDLRYNFQHYIEANVSAGWGVAQFATDPETGEYISNVANYFSNAGDTQAQYAVDRLQWMNGDLTDEQLLRGDITRQTVISRRNTRTANIHSLVQKALMENDEELVSGAGDELFKPTNPDADEERFSRMFKGTDIERELLVTDEILRSFAGPEKYQPSTPVEGGSLGSAGVAGQSPVRPGEVTEEALAAASPVSWGMGLDKNPYEKAVRELGSRAVDLAQFFDPQVAGLADYFKGKGREEIYQWVRHEFYTAVNGHEVGHTLGLRHNFGASMDPLNYRPEFWNEFWNNDPTPTNRNRSIEYKYASLMDYGFGATTEGLHGIGGYDAAAIRFMYGELVDVWDPTKITVPDPRKFGSFARRCGHDSSFYGLPILLSYMDYHSIPSILGQPASTEDSQSDMDRLFNELVNRMEANAASRGDKSNCTLFVADLNFIFEQVKQLDPHPENVYGARKPVPASVLLTQERASILNPPEYDDPSTAPNEAEDGEDQDEDGFPDDRGYDWNTYLHRVPYTFCPDDYAGYSPNCQRWDTGADFNEQIDAFINDYDSTHIFSHFRRDRYNPVGWGSGRSYMARLESRTLFHMTNVFRYYLYTRRSVLQAPLFEQWAKAAYKGINFLERIIQTPEPGEYCLNRTKNLYVPVANVAGTCADADKLTVGLGNQQGGFYNTSWSNEYNYKANRIGTFYDKLAVIRQLTSSSGRFIRDFSDLFDRRAFTLGYLRAWEDPIIRRFNSLVRGDFEGYRSAVVTDPTSNEKYVRYVPFFDEETDTGASVRQWLDPMPKIEPSWSWSLQYYALAYAISNFSSIADSSPEFYRFTKIAIKGTPEDIDYPAAVPVNGRMEPLRLVEFTDPESRIIYRAPELPARPIRSLQPLFPAYAKTQQWGIGADLLKNAQKYVTDVWEPTKQACLTQTGNAKEIACNQHQAARRNLNEQMGFIDIVRRFNRRAELPR